MTNKYNAYIQYKVVRTKTILDTFNYKMNLDYSLTHSCYDPDEKGRACGQCDSCKLRLKGFEEAHLQPGIDVRAGVSFEF